MKITVLTRSDEQLDEYDYREAFAMQVDDEKVFSVHDGEPEDNSLSRNFSSVYSIPSLLEKAFFAGQNDELFSIEYKIFEE